MSEPADNIPNAVWEGTFTIGGVTLRCATLDNGMRVVNTEDMARLFEGIIDSQEDADQCEAFMRWQLNKDTLS